MGIFDQGKETSISPYLGKRVILEPLDFFELFKDNTRCLAENLEKRLFYATVMKKGENGLIIRNGLLVKGIELIDAGECLKTYLIMKNSEKDDNFMNWENIYLDVVLAQYGLSLPSDTILKVENEKRDIQGENYSAILNGYQILRS